MESTTLRISFHLQGMEMFLSGSHSCAERGLRKRCPLLPWDAAGWG